MVDSNFYDVIVVGGGAAGLMAAVTAGKRGKKVLLIEHTDKIGEKIRISGGGRCNFTNIYTSHKNFICQNPHFVKSALASYSQHDFIHLLESHNISYHEKTLGQLFCDESSKQIINMLIQLCQENLVKIELNCQICDIIKTTNFAIKTNKVTFQSSSVIIASGGLSIPKIGASSFGYDLAKKFDLAIIPTKPALVPLIVNDNTKEFCNNLRGISNDSIVSYQHTNFRENILFTHKGLSGPAILQISSYLPSFDDQITINLLPNHDLYSEFMANKNSTKSIANFLKPHFTKRFIELMSQQDAAYNKRLTDVKKETLLNIANNLQQFIIPIVDSEGYLKAEVTAGGVSTDELSSKTMESKKIPGLFFVGEVVDVTGWLGGYNFQWAWSSGYAAGSAA
jgi:predicted Rossmann fold flavoprotein